MSQKVTLKSLQAQCTAYGLKTYGTKETLLNRIKEHEASVEEKPNNTASNESSSELNLEMQDDDDDDDFDDDYHEKEESDDDEIIEVQIRTQHNEMDLGSNSSTTSSVDESYEKVDTNSKKRTRVVSIFSLFQTYNNKESALDTIRADNTWNKERLRDTTDGIKETYQCKIRDCKRKCYLLFNSDSEQVSLWYNDQVHKHDCEKAQPLGMNAITKNEVEKLYRNKVVYPSRILSAFREMSEKLIPNPDKKDMENPFIENPTYVEGIDVPQKLQIKNYLQNTLKPKVSNTSKDFDYAALAQWAIDHRQVPDDPNQAFVIDDFIQVNNIVPVASILRLSLSTINLIGLARKRKHICGDTTWELIWEGISLRILIFFS